MRRSDGLRVGLVAVTVVLGMHSLRVLIPSIGWYLRDTVGVPAMGLVPYALGPALAGLVVAVAVPAGWRRHAVRVAGSALAGARLAEQMVTSAGGDLWCSMAGVAAFTAALALLADREAWAPGVLLGMAADTALKAVTGTVDLSWLTGALPVAVIAALVVGYLAALWLADLSALRPPRGRAALPLAAFGPLLLLGAMTWQNQGWVAAATGWPAPAAVGVILGADLLALAIVLGGPGPGGWLGVLAGAEVLLAAVGTGVTGPGFALVAVAGIVGTGGVLAAVRGGDAEPGGRAAVACVACGILAFIALGLLYYLALDVPLGLTLAELRWLFGAVAAVLGLLAWWGRRPTPSAVGWWPLAAGVALLLVPEATAIVSALRPPSAAPPPGSPITVMTYNVHAGFGTDGRQDLDALVATVAEADPDVLGVQEVTRGWLLGGGTDLVEVLSRRLGLRYFAYGPTVDPAWGNAILSRYPIVGGEQALLPAEGTLVQRGVVRADIDIGGEEPLSVAVTHLQHVNDPARHDDDPEADLLPVHAAQLDVVLDVAGGRRPAVLAGDLNAQPGWEQIRQVRQAGFRDAWDAGRGPGLTAGAADPHSRIDWIFHSRGLDAATAEVIASQASDHFPVVAELRR